MKDLMTVTEVADMCRTTAHTVYYWLQTGKGPRSMKVGRKRLYRREDVVAWLESQYTKEAR